MLPIIKSKLPELHIAYKKVDTSLSNPFNELDKIAGNVLPYSLAQEQGFICCYCMREFKVKKDFEGKTIYSDDLVDRKQTECYYIVVEHFKPQSIYNGSKTESTCDGKNRKRKDLRIDYNNLLASCEGCIEREKTQEETEKKMGRQFISGRENTFCDNHKGDNELCALPNPSDREKFNRVSSLVFKSNGVISSKNKEVNYEIGGEKDEIVHSPEGKTKTLFKEGVLNLNYEKLIEGRAAAWKWVEDRITRELGNNIDWNSVRKQALIIANKYHKMFSNRQSNGKHYEYCKAITYILERRFRELRTINY